MLPDLAPNEPLSPIGRAVVAITAARCRHPRIAEAVS